MLFVRYEDLTSKPAETMKMIYAYLEVPEFQHNFDSVDQVTQEDDQVYGTPGLHTIRPKVEPLVKDYMEVLGREAVRLIQNNHSGFFSQFGYPVPPV
jgi:hypothetical protein